MRTHTALDAAGYRRFCVSLDASIKAAQCVLNRPLTLTDKILLAHRRTNLQSTWLAGRGIQNLDLNVDQVALQDATAQMALLQFMQSPRKSVAVPTTIHCDHLIRAEAGGKIDLLQAASENDEVYAFLRTAAKHRGIGFWRAGSGIIHQVVLENYAFPGGLMIGTDSHTPNAGGLGMLAIGVGGADAAEVMSGRPWEVLHPKVIGVHLAGRLSKWVSPKDVITYLCTRLGVKGGTNKVIEYFGPGTESIGATGKATICNMGAELGATGSIFPFDSHMATYLRATNRPEIATVAAEYSNNLRADPGAVADPSAVYDEVVEINLDELEPWIVGPLSPDRGRAIRHLAEEAQVQGWPLDISACLIGSCTTSYEGICRAAGLVQQATRMGFELKTKLLVSPGSDQVCRTLKRDGILDIFEHAGAAILANACGPCIGQWRRTDIKPDQVNTIVSSFNRNFPKRNDGSAATLSFLTSPEIVVAMAFAGRLDFNPLCDVLQKPGMTLSFAPPQAEELPEAGFDSGQGYEAPTEDSEAVKIDISPVSDRLQLLKPFQAWSGEDFLNLPILVKTKGKTTTDHISPAGPWLRYRGHLDKISENMLLGAINAFTGETGKGSNPLTGEHNRSFAEIARSLKAEGVSWMIVGDENYGEGSSREHAAMTPRHLGCVAVLVKSFARIHETNLKKQGILPLVFVNPLEYASLEATDRVSIVGLEALAQGVPLVVIVEKLDGRQMEIRVSHSLTREQVEWFRAGSALNTLVA